MFEFNLKKKQAISIFGYILVRIKGVVYTI